MRKAWPVLAPDLTLDQFRRRIYHFRKACTGRIGPIHFDDGEPDPEDVAANSRSYEAVTYHYRGLERIRQLIDDRQPVCLLGWHHGAREHFAYSLLRVLPELSFFTLRKLQFGPYLTEPVRDLGPFTVPKMRSTLEQRKPIFYYIDGPPLGATIEAPMLGHASNFSATPLRMFCQFEGAQLVPVASRYHTPTDVYVRFLDPVRQTEGNEHELLRTVLGQLTAHLREYAPEQLLSRMMPYREKLAREMRATRAARREKREHDPDAGSTA